MMEPFVESDIRSFVALAEEEGWVTGEWELQFLLQSFPQGCLVWREDGCAVGYITSARHGNSAWIGNLLVKGEARGRGIGRKLMEGALDALLKGGAATIWLTASVKGEGLYRKLGFVSIDSINRWVGEGMGVPAPFEAAPFDMEVVRQVDRAGWGDGRDALLATTCGRGRTFCGNYSFVCCQPWEAGTQLGPWGSLFESEAEPLLDLALSSVEGRVFLDVPAGNVAAAALLTRRGFSLKGSNTLMYLGAEPRFEPKKVFALASMGSMG